MNHLKKVILLSLVLVAILLGDSLRRNISSPLILSQHNAVWSRSLFFKGYANTTGEPLTMSDIQEFANTLKANRIEYAYIFSGPFNSDGTLPDWAFSDLAIQSIQEIKKWYPEVKLLPWVGGVQGRTVFLDNQSWRERALASTKKLVETLKVTGVHFDFEKLHNPKAYDEPIPADPWGDSYAEGLIQFHKDVRSILPELYVSSVVVSTAKDTRPWKRKHSKKELEELFPLVDQISFLYYDTSIKDQEIFKSNLLEQLRTIKEIQDSTGSNPETLIAIGTFINDPSLRQYRDLHIENIPNSLETLKLSIVEMNMHEPIVDGIAVYCEWQTDEEEWRQIREHWTSVNQSSENAL